MSKKTYIIDASNKTLGRLASRISILLQGKDDPNYRPHEDRGNIVIVKNVEKIRLTGRKREQKKYYHHSGYLGGLKEVPLKKVIEKDPAEVLRKAVWGMLPKNKLRAKRIKRLKFE
ncbi:50S ribosomal protein L13 [bacterium]|nr:50S ribosomal protein L13 [bacterium]